ncbi:MAG: dicarboxylate/amino acid:cation symporter [Catenisphaera adipataccumulans]|jgi:Na+/H+-dicarboxylate symporter|uniref:dicarboxylate/amino acid:cation symporter n=1 Tax=Catenisphaera adipataccumulans TaxID=700500 RepID=UPI003D935D25
MAEKSKKMSLTTKIFISLLVGLAVGVIFNLWVPKGYIRDTIIVDGICYVIGNGFIRLMRMLVVPLVFFSLICGAAAIGDTKTLGKVGGKVILLYICTTAVAVTVALSLATVIKPGVGLDMSSIAKSDVSTASQTSMVDTILNIIPENPFNSLSEGTMLQVIVFALIVGILLAKMGERAELIANFCTQCNDLMMEMTNMIMGLAPLGVFCMIMRTFANLGFDAFVPLLKYIGNVILGLGIQCFVVYMIIFFIFTRLSPIKFFRKFFPVMAFAFSTSTSNATIPLNIETLEEKMGVSRRISSFTIPLGATINMDGTAIMQGVAVVFAAQAYGMNLGIQGYLTVIATATLASIGTAGVPSVGLITLTMVFSAVGLPVEAITLIMGVDRILDMLRTAVNITGDAVCTCVVAFQNGDLNKKVFNDMSLVKKDV